ncbi:Endonuclease/Exonuclease/phosphatase family protein [Sporothrix schenckii 1099-18]|uniref:Endonuclease/Exonuclease/phosphatase family protein n=1 Tax=Sporothrix schenckii 1099-18 TaxID=1397361 RepID=A0A0F2MAV1_SPOSC|nr:Endonuclease/Exonuclease/phosphatase family protein [Sporothrix schenckii 1099-18]KJR86772.1 Endonuclease/Exonuclease/phosphatase family protein [Sporothrix schenckii 1099-18]
MTAADEDPPTIGAPHEKPIVAADEDPEHPFSNVNPPGGNLLDPLPVSLASAVTAGITPPLLDTTDTQIVTFPWYIFDHAQDKWVISPPPIALSHDVVPLPGPPDLGPKDMTIVTWNVGHGRNERAERLASLIDGVQDADVEGCPDVVFLQELSGIAKHTLAELSFVRANYYIAGLEWMLADNKQEFYSAILMSRLRFARGSCATFPSLGAVWAVWYPSQLNRYALCCDIGAPTATPNGTGKTIRLANVHFDSLAAAPNYRRRQLGIVSELLHAPDVYGGLVAGGFNPFLADDQDQNLAEEHGLVDCWTRLRGDAAEFPGHTWSMHGPGSHVFPPARLDKIAVWGLTPKTMEILQPGTVSMRVPTALVDAEGDTMPHDLADPADPAYEPIRIPWSDHAGLVMTFALTAHPGEATKPKTPRTKIVIPPEGSDSLDESDEPGEPYVVV